MEKYNFATNVNSNIQKEVTKFPIHLRGNEIAELCIKEACHIADVSGFSNISSPTELFVLASKLRAMLRFAASTKRFDYDSISIDIDDEERSGEQMYRTLDKAAKLVSDVYHTGKLQYGVIISSSMRADFCRSLLWLVAMGLNTNQDLYNDYFK